MLKRLLLKHNLKKKKELAVKLKESDDKVKIAKTNKNRYDSKSK